MAPQAKVPAVKHTASATKQSWRRVAFKAAKFNGRTGYPSTKVKTKKATENICIKRYLNYLDYV